MADNKISWQRINAGNGRFWYTQVDSNGNPIGFNSETGYFPAYESLSTSSPTHNVTTYFKHLEPTTLDEVVVTGHRPQQYRSSFDSTVAWEPIHQALGIFGEGMKTVGSAVTPNSWHPFIKGALPYLSPSQWMGTLQGKGLPGESSNNGFGSSKLDLYLNEMFDVFTTPAAGKAVGSVASPLLKEGLTVAGDAIGRGANKFWTSYAKMDPENYTKLRTIRDDFADYDMYTRDGNPQGVNASDILTESSRGRGTVRGSRFGNTAYLDDSSGSVELKLPTNNGGRLNGSNAHVNLWNSGNQKISRTLRVGAAKVPELLPDRVNITSSDVPNTGFAATRSYFPFTDIIKGEAKRRDGGNYSWQSFPLNMGIGNKPGFVSRSTGTIDGFNNMATHSNLLRLNNALHKFGVSLDDISKMPFKPINEIAESGDIPKYMSDGNLFKFLSDNGLIDFDKGYPTLTQKAKILNESSNHPDYLLMSRIQERGESPYDTYTWGPQTVEDFNLRFAGQLRYPAYIDKSGKAVVLFPTSLKVGASGEGNALRGAAKAFTTEAANKGSDLLSKMKELFKKDSRGVIEKLGGKLVPRDKR